MLHECRYRHAYGAEDMGPTAVELAKRSCTERPAVTNAQGLYEHTQVSMPLEDNSTH